MEKMTLAELSNRVSKRQETLSQEVVSVKSLIMDQSQPGRIIVRRPNSSKEDIYEFDERVYRQVSSVVYGIPGSYIGKLVEGKAPNYGLAAANFNHWVEVSDDKEVLLLFRRHEGARIMRGMKSTSWNCVPYPKSIETLITKFGSEKELNLTRFDEDGLVIDFITKQLEPAGKRPGTHFMVNDPFQWGVRFSDSDVGMGRMTISPYTVRLRCTNGATTTTRGLIVEIPHTGKDSANLDQILSNLSQGVEMIDGYSQKVVDQIESSIRIQLGLDAETQEPDNFLNRFNREYQVTKLEDKYIREAWKVEAESIPEANVYRLYNSFTRAGTHAEELNPNAKLKLQALGGRLLELAQQNQNSTYWN